LEVFVGDVVAGGSEVDDRVVEVLGVPEHERVEREAERAELVFLAFSVGLAGSFDRHRSWVSGLSEFSGELPTAALAEEIETPGDGQVRALVVHAGDPVLSSPNGARLEQALPGLELMVCFDMYLTETSRHADYILPPPSPLETLEYDLALSLLAVRNVAHYSPPLFTRPPGARDDWEGLAGLTNRLFARDRRGRVGALAFRTAVQRLGADGLLDLLLRLGPYGHPAGVAALIRRTIGRGPIAGAIESRLRGSWGAGDGRPRCHPGTGCRPVCRPPA
jgi:anaerobic selenocysteine-containing dehydrogenase